MGIGGSTSEAGGGPAHGRLDQLECVRGLAALYVFMHHFVRVLIVSPALHRLMVFGQAAVMTFFILSGFMIYYSVTGKASRPTFRQYLGKRFWRIYPPFVTALILAWLSAVFRAGHAVTPGVDLFGNLVMLQDDSHMAGVWFDPFLGNSPLWSLSYEWSFYMLFFPLFARYESRGRSAFPLVVALSCFGAAFIQFWPNPPLRFLSYFVLWWSGVELCKEYLRTGAVSLRGQIRTLVGLSLVLTILVGGALTGGLPSVTSLYYSPWLEVRHSSTALVLFVAAIALFRLGVRVPAPVTHWLVRLGGISYGLYVLHMPVLQAARLLRGQAIALAVIPVVFLLAWLVEQPLRKAISRRRSLRTPRVLGEA